MIVIQDEQLSERLNEIAQRKNQSVEDVLRSLLERDDDYPLVSTEETTESTDETVRRIRQNAYAEARRYWQETGDSARLALTDAELDDQFWTFDGEGIPRLKSEQGTIELPPGSGWLLAQAAVNAKLESLR
jgi:hypothetical protein